jgi:hypothetical protein
VKFFMFLPILSVILSFSGTALAHDTGCGETRLTKQQQARVDKWAAQRAGIEILEKTGADYQRITRAYRSLIQDLFNTDAAQRTAILKANFATTPILNMVEMRDPAQRFTEGLIRAMEMLYSREKVLEKLRALADLEAKKLS